MTSTPGLAGLLLAYTAARLGIVAAVAGLLVLAGVPLLLALLIGLIAALPLAMVLLRGLRARLDVAMAASRERRAAQREVLRARLRGDDAGDAGELPGGAPAAGGPVAGRASDQAAPRQSDRGQD